MKSLRTLSLAAALVVAGMEAVSAAPMSAAPLGLTSTASIEADQPKLDKVVLFCGPFRCVRRYGWRRPYYGWRRPYYGYGWRRPLYAHRWRRW